MPWYDRALNVWLACMDAVAGVVMIGLYLSPWVILTAMCLGWRP